MVLTINNQKLRCICRSSTSVLRRNFPASAIHSTGKGSTVLLMKSSMREEKCCVTFLPYGPKLRIHMITVCPASMKSMRMTVRKMKTASLHQRGVSMFCQLMSSGCGAGSYSNVTDVKGTWPNFRRLNQHIQRWQFHQKGALPSRLWQSSISRKRTKAEPHIRSRINRIRRSSASSFPTCASTAALRNWYHLRQVLSQKLLLPGSWYASAQRR
mmetsp:Transcript_25298/g.72492  ORF Transcript_25298/g.72492 Transcript_25298/m.72492 type:complete len:213 (+) Transcript_25298:1164-1802(+)